LAFQPVYLKDLLWQLCDDKRTVDEFLGSDGLLKKARLSFGYFEHFPRTTLENPFDLMARCLFRGSALTLHSSFRGIDLMIPLVLGSGQISFLGVQVRYVKEDSIDDAVQKAIPKMSYSYIFQPQSQSDRPFAMILLVHTTSDCRVYIEKPKIEKTGLQNLLDNPDVLVFKGISKNIRGPKSLYNSAPTGIMYRGIDEKYLKKCDHMLDIINDIPYSPMDPSEFPDSEGGPSNSSLSPS
jgi:hypothetical protein